MIVSSATASDAIIWGVYEMAGHPYAISGGTYTFLGVKERLYSLFKAQTEYMM